MTPDEEAQMADLLVFTQSRAMACVFVIEALLIEVAKQNADPRAFLSRCLEHSLYRFDRTPDEERRSWTEARASIEQLFSRAGRDVFRPKKDSQ